MAWRVGVAAWAWREWAWRWMSHGGGRRRAQADRLHGTTHHLTHRRPADSPRAAPSGRAGSSQGARRRCWRRRRRRRRDRRPGQRQTAANHSRHLTHTGQLDPTRLYTAVLHAACIDQLSVSVSSVHVALLHANTKYLTIYHKGGSVAEWLACWTQAQKGPGSIRSRDAVG